MKSPLKFKNLALLLLVLL